MGTIDDAQLAVADLERYASPAAAGGAVAALTDADLARLMLVATAFCRRRVGGALAPEDLLHEAIAKTLDGRRRWSRSVRLVRHLARVMESDSGHVAEAASRRGPAVPPDEPSAPGSSPHEVLVAREERERLLALFADDALARRVLELRLEQRTAAEIRRALDLGPTRYDTINRRLRRRLVRHYGQEASDGQ